MKDKKELKCTLNPGEIIKYPHESKKLICYTLQIENNHLDFSRKSELKRYLQVHYGITLKEYYNLVVYGSIDNSPKCGKPECPNECGWDEHHMKYSAHCSQSCGKTMTNRRQVALGINPFQNPELIKRNAEISRVREKERMLKLWAEGKHQWQKPGAMAAKGKKRGEFLRKVSLTGDNPYQKPDSNRKTTLFRYKKLGCTEIDTYLCILNNGNIKVGVSKDYIGRNYRLNTKFSSHSILRSTPENCTQLECDIKIKFCHKATEEFDYDKLNDVIKYIKEFKSALN